MFGNYVNEVFILNKPETAEPNVCWLLAVADDYLNVMINFIAENYYGPALPMHGFSVFYLPWNYYYRSGLYEYNRKRSSFFCIIDIGHYHR